MPAQLVGLISVVPVLVHGPMERVNRGGHRIATVDVVYAPGCEARPPARERGATTTNYPLAMLELIDGREQSTPVHIPRPNAVTGPNDPAAVVRGIIDEVRLKGDEALIEMTARFDGPRLTPGELRVPEETIAKARSLVRPELIDALEVMAARLRRTCEQQAPKELCF